MGPVGGTQGGPGACWSPGGAYQRQGAPSDTGAGHVPYMTHPSAPGQVGGGTEEPGTLSKGSTSGAVGSRLLWASESLALSRSLSRRGVGQAWAARAHPSRVPRVLPDPDFRPQPPQEDVVCCGSCQDLAAGAGWGGGGTWGQLGSLSSGKTPFFPLNLGPSLGETTTSEPWAVAAGREELHPGPWGGTQLQRCKGPRSKARVGQAPQWPGSGGGGAGLDQGLLGTPYTLCDMLGYPHPITSQGLAHLQGQGCACKCV